MHLGLLAHISAEPYKPFYYLSTKGGAGQIIVDGIMELTEDYEVGYLGDMGTGRKFVLIQDSDINGYPINKDWLIRAKRNPKSNEYQMLKHKFFRKDEE